MNATQALGWALLHSVWQCALAAAALAALLATVPMRAARTRYALALTTLLLMLAVPVGTAVRLRTAPPPTRGLAPPPPSGLAPTMSPAAGSLGLSAAPAPRPSSPLPTPVWVRVRALVEPALPAVVAAWLAGVLILSVRLGSGWWVTRRLGSTATRPVPSSCRDALARLAARLRVTRAVQVLESAAVQVPAVVGWLRPVILLPASALTGLTPLQLDALLAHELAHIRRYDYLVNLVQSVIETVLFYHPAVWWVSQRVREEREHCCDDVAVAACGDARFYAVALLGMERLRTPLPALSVAATGGSLVGRVRRLMAPMPAELVPPWLAGALAVTLALGLALGGAGLAHSPRLPAVSAARDSAAGLIARLGDAHARREIIRVLRRGGDPRAVAVLSAIAREDPDEDIQREAVRALGKLPDGAGLEAVVEIAQRHADEDVRHEAVEELGKVAPPAVALAVLPEIVRRDPNRHIQHEAVEALGRLHDQRTFPVLLDLARHHPAADVRRKAVSELGRPGQPDSAADVLEQMVLNDSDAELQHEAVEALGHLGDPRVLAFLARLARTHPSTDVRDEATEQYARYAPTAAALALLTDRLANDRASEVKMEAVEELAELPRGAGIPAVIEAARENPSADVRAEAWRQLRESDDSRARAFVRRTARP